MHHALYDSVGIASGPRCGPQFGQNHGVVLCIAKALLRLSTLMVHASLNGSTLAGQDHSQLKHTAAGMESQITETPELCCNALAQAPCVVRRIICNTRGAPEMTLFGRFS